VVPEFGDQSIRELFLGSHRMIYQVADGPAQVAKGLAQVANDPAMMVRPNIPPSGADERRRRP
jgi:hypothetical protein